MIEQIIIKYLSEVLEIPVSTEVPTTGEKFIVIEKVGSSIENHVNTATIAVQSYAPSMYETAELNQLVKETLDGIIYATDISKAECNTDYNYPDLQRKKERYQAIYDFVY